MQKPPLHSPSVLQAFEQYEKEPLCLHRSQFWAVQLWPTGTRQSPEAVPQLLESQSLSVEQGSPTWAFGAQPCPATHLWGAGHSDGQTSQRAWGTTAHETGAPFWQM